MSALTICNSNPSPKGVLEEFAQFDITNDQEQFRFPNMMDVDKEYSLSFWITSDCNGSIDILGETLTLQNGFNSWIKYEKSYISEEEDLVIGFNKVGKYYIYQMQLETGNIPTAYRESPDDVEAAIGRTTELLTKIIDEQETAIVQTSKSIVLSALEHYVETSVYENFRRDVEAKLEVNAENISMNFSQASSDIKKLGEATDGRFVNYEKYITFSEDGILIGDDESSQLKLRIDNKGIKFMNGSDTIGFWDGTDFHTGNIYVDTNERAQFGEFAFYPEQNGGLAFRKVGG